MLGIRQLFASSATLKIPSRELSLFLHDTSFIKYELGIAIKLHVVCSKPHLKGQCNELTKAHCTDLCSNTYSPNRILILE
jgi:hypothetical protein